MKVAHTKRLLNVCIFLSAVIAILFDYLGSSWFLAMKPLTTVLVILVPVLEKNMDKVFRRLLIIALCFCLLGDILLMKPNYFIYGLGAFLIAHLVFTKGFIGLYGFQRNPIVAMALLIIGIGLYAWLYPDLSELKYAVAAYVLVILVMVWQAVGLYLNNKTTAFALIALGALFFMFSDSLIAVNKFKTPFELSGVVILSTYWLAITLIANGGSIYFK